MLLRFVTSGKIAEPMRIYSFLLTPFLPSRTFTYTEGAGNQIKYAQDDATDG